MMMISSCYLFNIINISWPLALIVAFIPSFFIPFFLYLIYSKNLLKSVLSGVFGLLVSAFLLVLLAIVLITVAIFLFMMGIEAVGCGMIGCEGKRSYLRAYIDPFLTKEFILPLEIIILGVVLFFYIKQFRNKK